MVKLAPALFASALLLLPMAMVESRDVRHRRVKSKKSSKASSNSKSSEDTSPTPEAGTTFIVSDSPTTTSIFLAVITDSPSASPFLPNSLPTVASERLPLFSKTGKKMSKSRSNNSKASKSTWSRSKASKSKTSSPSTSPTGNMLNNQFSFSFGRHLTLYDFQRMKLDD